MTTNDRTDNPFKGFGNTIACAMLFLGMPTVLVVALIVILLDRGVSPIAIEKWMVWLSVPWFTLCYASCRMAHGIKLVIAPSDDEAS